MKAFISLTLLICLAFVSFAQVASGPPVDTETITMESQESAVFEAVLDNDFEPGLYATPVGTVLSCNCPHLSVSGSPFTSSGTLSLGTSVNIKTTPGYTSMLPVDKIPYNTGPSLLPERSKIIENPNLPYAYAYQWNPGYVGWQR